MMNGILQMFIQKAMQSKDPRAATALGLIQNGDVEGQKRMAENLCASCGITVDDAIKRIQGNPGAFMNK